MNTFDTINICTGYEVKGQVVQDLTYETLANPVTPLYTPFDGWMQELKGISDFQDLPDKLKQYTSFIEADAGLPVKILSIGAGREETILK